MPEPTREKQDQHEDAFGAVRWAVYREGTAGPRPAARTEHVEESLPRSQSSGEGRGRQEGEASRKPRAGWISTAQRCGDGHVTLALGVRRLWPREWWRAAQTGATAAAGGGEETTGAGRPAPAASLPSSLAARWGHVTSFGRWNVSEARHSWAEAGRTPTSSFPLPPRQPPEATHSDASYSVWGSEGLDPE